MNFNRDRDIARCSVACPSYKFRPAQKSGPFRVMPDSVCDPHTILLHGVLSDFRSRAKRQLEIIALVINWTSFGATGEASRWSAQNTRIFVPDGIHRRDRTSMILCLLKGYPG